MSLKMEIIFSLLLIAFPSFDLYSMHYSITDNYYAFTSYAETLLPCGVKLKDGSTMMNLYDGLESGGYADEESNTYISRYAFERVIDPSQVEAVPFCKDNVNGDTETEEPEYYEVVVK